MKLRELINKLEEFSQNGKNDDYSVILSQPDIPIAGPIQDIYDINTLTIKYICIEMQ